MKRPRSPGVDAVRAVPALSLARARHPDPLASCNICDFASEHLGAWREHDEWDVPVQGAAALVYIGKDHPKCIKVMESHPRLYAEDAGLPGSFPRLCGPCVLRKGLACTHQDLKANGGAGLKVSLTNAFGGAILCGPGGCRVALREAMGCDGQMLRDER